MTFSPECRYKWHFSHLEGGNDVFLCRFYVVFFFFFFVRFSQETQTPMVWSITNCRTPSGHVTCFSCRRTGAPRDGLACEWKRMAAPTVSVEFTHLQPSFDPPHTHTHPSRGESNQMKPCWRVLSVSRHQVHAVQTVM